MGNSILYINACVRTGSRTRRLAERLLQKLDKPYDELRLEDCSFPTVNEEYLDMRDSLISAGDFQSSEFALARQFADAEMIVIAAPYWDLSFPASLKQYIELINVIGVTFRYSEEGIPVGLCKAKKIYYVTTAGGTFTPEDFGFGYIKALANNYYGIKDVIKIEAKGLDIYGSDDQAILKAAEESISDVTVD